MTKQERRATRAVLPNTSVEATATELSLGNQRKVDCVHPSDVGVAPAIYDRRMMSIDEFLRRYGIGRTMAYAEMNAGHLIYCKVGSRRFIRVDDAEAWSWSKRQPPPISAITFPDSKRDSA